MAGEYRLYVVRSDTIHPTTWDPWGEPIVVVARDPEEARQLAEVGSWAIVTEIPLDGPRVLFRWGEPRHGEDL